MTDKQTDYLIMGAGAVGLAFADTLLDEDPDCHITIVDKHAKPGGHWNDAYGFVALHQPSAFYGVNSMEFGDDVPDAHGPNKGYFPLATGTEVSAYFTRLMNRRLLPSGRVDYRPLAEITGFESGAGTVRAILSGREDTIAVRRKLVDATFYKTSVPSTHKRPFAVTDGVDVAVPGALPDLWKRADDLPQHYCILGGGKTAMDVGVWLLQAGIEPTAVHWVRPRDSWLINRRYTQPGPDNFADIVANQVAQLKAAADAPSGDAMFEALGEDGYMLRIDESVVPTMFHYATISQGEVDELRRITQVIRDGRVTAIEPGRLLFGEAARNMPDDTLYIDCTASAVPFDDDREHGPQFRGDRIVLQPIQVPLVTLSAALTAFIEVHYDDDARKNALAAPAPLTDTPNTYPLGLLANLTNRGKWSQEPTIAAWLSQVRLDPTGRTMAKMMAEGDTRLSAIGAMGPAIAKGMPGLKRLAAMAERQHEKDIQRCCD